MIDIETASRSVDIIVGFAVLAVIAVVFFAWLWIRLNNVEVNERIQKAVDKAVRKAKEETYAEGIRGGAKRFEECMQLKKVVKEQDELIRNLTSENQRMQSIIERASR